MSPKAFISALTGLNTPRASQQSRRLARRTAGLVALCAAPLAGLAIYFLSTGLNANIARGAREREGLRQVKEAVALLHPVIESTWRPHEQATAAAEAFERGIVALERARAFAGEKWTAHHASFASGSARRALPAQAGPWSSQPEMLGVPPRGDEIPRATKTKAPPPDFPGPGAGPPGPGLVQPYRTLLHAVDDPPTARELRGLWQSLEQAPPGVEERDRAQRELATRINRLISHLCDRAGLRLSPEAETHALTDIVGVWMPFYLERLLRIRESLVTTFTEEEGPRGWDVGILFQHLQWENAASVARSASIALQADADSPHAIPSFQRDYPTRVKAFLAGLKNFATDVYPGRDRRPALAEVDGRLLAAAETGMEFWRESLEQLDAQLVAHTAYARAQRDRAFLAAAALSLLLLPAAALYFRLRIRPVLQDMAEAALEQQRLAAEARAAADDSARRLRQIQSALDTHCAVLVMDAEHRVLAVNDRFCRLSGYTRAEMLQQSPFLYIPEMHPAGYADGIWTEVTAGRIWRGEICQRTREGRRCWVDTTVFPISDAQGRPVEFIAIETDITELVRAREAAESAAQAKSQFLAMMSHEIRTPMNGVIGFANLLADTSLDETQRDHLRTILTSGESLLAIINDILDFSKLEAGRTELESRPVSLRLLVEDVLDLLATQARAKGLELVYSIAPEVPEGILGDETRLRQILLNLAGNAVKFTATGYVEIALARAPAPAGQIELAVHVRDTGIGIPAERRDRLFKAFSQVDASITRSHGGTGLGLAISQRLVSLMGGTIDVTSEPGKGSDFHFRLPVVEADVAGQLRTRATVAPQQLEAALRGKCVLVVDDLPANQRLLEGILARYGASMVPASTGAEALAALARQHFDLAVLDYVMPGENGHALALKIRARAEWARLPLVLVTSTQVPAAEARGGLFATVLAKPLRTQPCAAAVAQALVSPKKLAPDTALPTGESPAAFAATHPLRVAVVDDNPVNLKVITATLVAFGYRPESFASARAALVRLGAERFDLVLMDVQMPDLNGLEATRELRAGAAGELNRRTRVIALTAGAMAEERAACLAAGMDDFVAKPVPRAKLLEKLAEAAELAHPAAPETP